MKIIYQLAAGITIGCLLGYKSIIALIESIKENNE